MLTSNQPCSCPPKMYQWAFGTSWRLQRQSHIECRALGNPGIVDKRDALLSKKQVWPCATAEAARRHSNCHHHHLWVLGAKLAPKRTPSLPLWPCPSRESAISSRTGHTVPSRAVLLPQLHLSFCCVQFSVLMQIHSITKLKRVRWDT